MRPVVLFLTLGMLLSGLAIGAEPQPAISIDQALEQLKTYDYGQNDQALHVLQLHVARSAADPGRRAELAVRLASILAEPKTIYAAKVFICQQLVVIGADGQVPVLARMLDDPQTAEIARYTLDAIPGEASSAALRGALDRLQGPALAGAINSLGLRGDPQAVSPLAKLLGSGDPQVAASAAEALGKIGTADAAAALVKAQVPDKAQVMLHNAQLQCAERRCAAGDAAAAAAIYEQVWSSRRGAAKRLAALAGLVKTAPDKALPLVLEALASDEPLLRSTAVRLSRQLPGPKVTVALAERIDRLGEEGQALLVAELGERGDRAAAEAVAKRLDDPRESVQVAAVQAMEKLGDASCVERIARLASSSGASQAAARTSLARLTSADIESRLRSLASAGEPAVRVECLRALGMRRAAGAMAELLSAAADPEGRIRAAAFEALGMVASAEHYPAVVRLLAASPTPADSAAAERAVLAAAERMADASARAQPVLAALAEAPPANRPGVLRVLAGLGGAEALGAVRARLQDPDAAVRDAALRAVANWPDASAAADMLQLAQSAEKPNYRVLALRGYLRLSGEVKDEAARLKMLEQVRPVATTLEAKRALLAALSEIADSGALHLAAGMIDDPSVQAEAVAATLKIARAVVRTDAATVRAAMKKLLGTTKDKAVAEQAAAIDEEAARPPDRRGQHRAMQYDKKRSDAQKAALSKRAPPGYRLACYLDCGPDSADGAKGGPQLRLVSGSPYGYSNVADTEGPLATVAFDSRQIVFEAVGLDPKKSYQVGFTWWDVDHDTRVQSVALAAGKGDREITALENTKLPSGVKQEKAAEKTLLVPRDLYGNGTLRIVFRAKGLPNAVVSELWLWEGEPGK